MIDREDRKDFTIVWMSRGHGNSLNREFLQALVECFNVLEESPARSVVLTAEGSCFSAGVDLPAVLEGGRHYLQDLLPAINALVERLLTFPKPVIAAVGGHAIAGGCVAVLACDHRVMARGKPTIGLTELLVGVPFPTLALEIVRARLPERFLREVLYTGQTYLAEAALARGLIDEVVEPAILHARACEKAEELARIEPDAFRITKQQLCLPILDRWRRYCEKLDGQILDAWSSSRVHKAIEEFVAARVKR